MVLPGIWWLEWLSIVARFTGCSAEGGSRGGVYAWFLGILVHPDLAYVIEEETCVFRTKGSVVFSVGKRALSIDIFSP